MHGRKKQPLLRQSIRTFIPGFALTLVVSVASPSKFLQLTQTNFNTPFTITADAGGTNTTIVGTFVPISVVFDTAFCA